MEITTTMVRFRYPKEAMEKRTDKAQLFLCGNRESPEKVWVPFSKLNVQPDEEDEEYNLITMPKWLYLKGILPYYSEAEEFVVTSEVPQEQLNQQV